MLKLIKRSKMFLEGYKAYCQEYYDQGIMTFKPADPKRVNEAWFDASLDWYEKKELGLMEGQPKSFHYWAVDGDRFIGEFQLRPELDDQLMTSIGSIGYAVKTTEWGKGYGHEILKQGLIIARDHGLDKVFLIINSDNVKSWHLCEKHGGVLHDEKLLTSENEGERMVRSYWIYL